MSVLFVVNGISDLDYRDEVSGYSSSSTYTKEYMSLSWNSEGCGTYVTVEEDLDEFWISCNFRGTRTQDNYPGPLSLLNSSGDKMVWVEGSGDTYNAEYSVYVDGTEAGTLYFDERYVTTQSFRLDLHIKTGPSGFCKIYCNRVLLGGGYVDLTDFKTSDIKELRLDTTTNATPSVTVESIFMSDEDSTQLTHIQLELESGVAVGDISGDYSNLDSIGSTGEDSSVVSDGSGDGFYLTFEDRSSEFYGGSLVSTIFNVKDMTSNSEYDGFIRLFSIGGGEDVYGDYQSPEDYYKLHYLSSDSVVDSLSDIPNVTFGFEVSEYD